MPLPREKLSARETAVLELLGRGHTIKSAAEMTGDSEGAVNELLRSARRKLGVASSREAARLLANDRPHPVSQENRDEFIGVAELGGQAPEPVLVANRRTLVMLGILLAATVGGAMLAKDPDTGATSGGPRIVAATPGDGATIAPGPFTLWITFDRPMRRDSFSFATGPEAKFPSCDRTPSISRDGRSFSLRCMAKAGDSYVVWANHGRFSNFRSLDGVAASPTRIGFRVTAR